MLAHKCARFGDSHYGAAIRRLRRGDKRRRTFCDGECLALQVSKCKLSRKPADCLLVHADHM